MHKHCTFIALNLYYIFGPDRSSRSNNVRPSVTYKVFYIHHFDSDSQEVIKGFSRGLQAVRKRSKHYKCKALKYFAHGFHQSNYSNLDDKLTSSRTLCDWR